MKKRLPWILAGLLIVSVYFNLFFLLNWQNRPPEVNPSGTYMAGSPMQPEYIVLQKDGQYSRYRPLDETALGRGTWEVTEDGRCFLAEETGEIRTALLQREELYLPVEGDFLHFNKCYDIPLYNSAPDDAVLDPG